VRLDAAPQRRLGGGHHGVRIDLERRDAKRFKVGVPDVVTSLKVRCELDAPGGAPSGQNKSGQTTGQAVPGGATHIQRLFSGILIAPVVQKPARYSLGEKTSGTTASGTLTVKEGSTRRAPIAASMPLPGTIWQILPPLRTSRSWQT
jgi:hypothetical protein